MTHFTFDAGRSATAQHEFISQSSARNTGWNIPLFQREYGARSEMDGLCASLFWLLGFKLGISLESALARERDTVPNHRRHWPRCLGYACRR